MALPPVVWFAVSAAYDGLWYPLGRVLDTPGHAG
jgi:hypothetical protein